jgi:hypothetical protein
MTAKHGLKTVDVSPTSVSSVSPEASGLTELMSSNLDNWLTELSLGSQFSQFELSYLTDSKSA